MAQAPLLRLAAIAVVAALAAPVSASAQRDTTVVAGPEYARSGFYRWLFGGTYRDLWTAPVTAPLLDLQTVAGGLTPTTAGGGFQTKSLRFRGADGYQYAFRSVDKDPGVLPPELDSTFIRGIVKDQISAGHPGAPGVAGPLLDAAGILHADETLVVLPDDARLGDFRQRFAGTLGFFSRRVIVEPGRSTLRDARAIIPSRELLPLLRRSSDDLIDDRALLAARLMDMYLGDWDRHRGQWTWARFGDTRPRRWVPIPEDRDQAFAHFGGLLPTLARHGAAPFLVAFGESYGSIVGQFWNGRDVDRWFLGGLDRAAWDSAATGLQSALTDSVIGAAVRRLPDAWYVRDGDALASALRRRRDALPSQEARYYRLLAREAEVHGTAADEQIEVERLMDGRTAVRVATRGAAEPWFARTYDRQDTKEIRIHTRGGADRVMVRGDGPAAITIRLVADSAVTVTDSSRAGPVRRYDAGWTPAARRAVRRIGPLPQRPGAALDEPTPARDWGAQSQPMAWLAYGPDLGAFVGYGVTRTGYAFRHTPFGSRWTLKGGWAFKPVTGRVTLAGVVHREQSGVATEVAAHASGLEVLNWYGTGNETGVSQPKSYYAVDQREVGLDARLAVPVGVATLRLGPTLRFSRTLVQAGRIIADSQPYGAGNFGQAGLRGSIDVDTRDIPAAATRGVAFSLGGSAYPAAWGVQSSFGEVHAVASTYLTAGALPLRPTLALRAGGKRVFGTYPFHEAAFIGDASTARLGRQNRFAGDAAAWGNAELRLSLARVSLLVPGRLGVFGLLDGGRVFVAGESSDRWHGAAGAGLWIALLQPANVLSIAVARSAERTAVYLGAGLAY
jgi:hypothetical protein